MSGRGEGPALLVVLAGRPGTGKTTLARRLARGLGAVHLRVDAVETAALRVDPTRDVGVLGYAVVHDLATANLRLGLGVVVDAVNPVHEARRGWHVAADEAGARLLVLETRLDDVEEHRRRVSLRLPDLPGQVVPGWHEVEDAPWQPWDETVDGPRTVVDTADAEHAARAALAACRAALT